MKSRRRPAHVILPLLALVAVAPGMGGCIQEDARIAVGRDFSMARMVAIKRGITTDTDVTELLGPPYKKFKLDERKEKWRYYMRKEQKETFLWLFSTGTHVTENELIIVFHDRIVESVEKHSESYEQ